MHTTESLIIPRRSDVIDTDPTVTFDVGVGKQLDKGQVIDIDYSALRQSLSALDAPNDNSHLSVEVWPKHALPSGVKGAYSPDTTEVVVGMNKPADTNKSLRHELGHYADFANNPLSRKDEIENKIGQTALEIVTPAATVNIGLGATKAAMNIPGIDQLVSSEFSHSPAYTAALEHLQSSYNLSTALALGAAAVSGIFYYGHKRERIARKAGKQDLPPIIGIR
ncbi:MAG TPA: hypothetical protein VFM68_00055 [Candidatus Saccharimonadales bacterium]|nr:hypothetical protein [Candidatus Saccharimonadales bacterium]